jgi:hypothetical protein
MKKKSQREARIVIIIPDMKKVKTFTQSAIRLA